MERREMLLEEIEQRYPNRWVLVEETAWDERGNPIRGIVHAHSESREALEGVLSKLHTRPGVKTFVFYTGEKIPEDLIVVL